MTAALLLAAGICASPPLFDATGPTCVGQRQSVECTCSECMLWDAVAEATRYEVVRQTISTGAVYTVGTVLQRFVDEEGTLELPTAWCFAHDSSFPQDGVLYRYQVRACKTGVWMPECGAWSDGVQYRGAPYACFDQGREVACYVGDSLATR